MIDQTLTLPDGRTVGFSDYGKAGDAPVIWCHGGPGSRLEAAAAGVAAQALGLRVIGIDRPGYGLSSLNTGRSIADWAPDCLAVADALGLETFMTTGMSTGGAYALSVAAIAPDRVKAVVTGCAMTDMRHPAARASMPGPTTHGVWDAPSREAALAIAADTFGEDGTKMMGGLEGLPEADMAFLTHPDYAAGCRSQPRRHVRQWRPGLCGRPAGRWGGLGQLRCRQGQVPGHHCPRRERHHRSRGRRPPYGQPDPPGGTPALSALGHFSVGEPAVAALVELARK